ncbi:hypothetical protein MHU86_19582 [Fragilaria crotonensis]|nr:hypothetical protein MHU86_19582 [Fragilaria crotonensis]
MCYQSRQPSDDAPQSGAYSWNEIPRLGCQMLRYILASAWNGQLLPLVSIMFAIHWVLELCVLQSDLHSWSYLLLSATGLFVLVGYLLLMALYRHSIHVVFNSKVPLRFLPSFAVHLEMMKPLEIIWRYLTCRFRILPDIIVLGEVRCGTTTFCQHLASIDGCHEPFCLWRHPELDKKETFFFVGHYLGIVDPQKYSLCFPLAITRFFYQRILRRPFFTFDGCAQYLSSPTAPYLIAKAYRDAGKPPPVLVACVRDPMEQTISWWNYENNAIVWGKRMGLVDWNNEIRTKNYPPQTLSNAFSFSSSDEVEIMYKRAEDLCIQNGTVSKSLPDWAVTWPGGQLSGIGRNGCFAANNERYERVFRHVFGESKRAASMVPSTSNLQFVNVVTLDSMHNTQELQSTLASIAAQINARNCSSGGGGPAINVNAIHPKVEIHRNASEKTAAVATSSDLMCMAKLFSSDTNKLNNMCGTKFDWTTIPPSE